MDEDEEIVDIPELNDAIMALSLACIDATRKNSPKDTPQIIIDIQFLSLVNQVAAKFLEVNSTFCVPPILESEKEKKEVLGGMVV